MMLLAVAMTYFSFTNAELAKTCDFGPRAEDLPIERQFDGGRCLGFIQSTVNLYTSLSMNREDLADLCVPESASIDQLRLVFVKYSNDHPEMLNEEAIVGLVYGLMAAWPCENTTP
jgi:hypothetical protein